MVRYRHTYLDNSEVLYFITYVTKNRCNYFTDKKDMRQQWSNWKSVLDKCGGSIFAFVFISNHTHIMIYQGNQTYSESVRKFKRKMNKVYVGNRGTIWQPRFWEHLIRDEDDLFHHTDYIHFNPVKHKIVNRPIDYPYSSFKQFVSEGSYTEDWGEESDINCAGEPQS